MLLVQLESNKVVKYLLLASPFFELLVAQSLHDNSA